MNLILVNYTVKIGTRRFTQRFSVQVIPPQGAELKISNYGFVVSSVCQDLDSYATDDHLHDSWCENVIAVPDKIYKTKEFPKIIEDLIFDHWVEKKPIT